MRKLVLIALLATIFPTLVFSDPARLEKIEGSWSIMAATDSMTDETWYGAITHSNTGADLQMSCHWNRPAYLYMSFTTKEFLGNGYRDATYRVDSKTARTMVASYSDKHAIPLCDGRCKGDGKSEPQLTLLSEMKNGTKLLLRLTTFRSEDLEFSFPISAAQEAAQGILAKCAALAVEKKPKPQLKHP